mmetsp:Transcript_1138/g.1994  ORF Transcript_1138/g.1994 Transcript_1138/m.1994 type:complete len:188 (+) Transcript_1138:1-564(+)
MAQGLAALHEHKDGVIVHSDADLSQFLLDPNGKIKLNDFNYGTVMKWNTKNEHYCAFKRKHYASSHRSPEEYSGALSDESKDTYVYGNGVYSLLTGFDVFYDERYNHVSKKELAEAIQNGKRSYIDDRFRTRSFIEKKLVELIEACWAQNGKDRPKMSDVVSLLQEVKAEAKQKGELEASKWLDMSD